MKPLTKTILIACILLAGLALIALPVSATPLIEVYKQNVTGPDGQSYNLLQPPASFLMGDPVAHTGQQVGFQLWISDSTARKYLRGNDLSFLYLKWKGAESRGMDVDLLTKERLYPYTEYIQGYSANDQLIYWYPGWAPQPANVTVPANS